MSKAKPFQVATIEAAMRAFDARRTVRRFLVADEVGLGKTIVARGVIERMMKGKARTEKKPLSVFYVCSSLAIAAQNKQSLLKVLEDPQQRRKAASDVDRLTLAPNRRLSGDLPLHLYTLTPETSIPDRRGKHRSGSVQERALLHNLLLARDPDLVKHKGKGEWLQHYAPANWAAWKRDSRTQPKPALVQAFFPILRNQLGLTTGQHLHSAVRGIVSCDPLEAIKQLRIALARTGLKRLAPDLVIFDEFQRFQDLVAGDAGGSEVAKEMVRIGRDGPAVLLLSATPYRLYGGDTENLFGEKSHHAQFFELVEWLLGGEEKASQGRKRVEDAFHRYGEALTSPAPTGPETLAAKRKIEGLLQPIIARTERFALEAGRDAAEGKVVDARLIPEDLQVFTHLVDCFHGLEGRDVTGAAVAYWTSVPLPMQTLGPDYVAWKGAVQKQPNDPALALTLEQTRKFGGPHSWPHPRLRALSESFPPAALATPWLPPSLPWWNLGGRWLTSPPEKALLFSRFRAVPRAVSGLLSYDLERYLLDPAKLRFDEVTKKTLLGPQRENLAFFHPSPVLSMLLDPWQLREKGADPRGKVPEDLVRRALAERGISGRRAARDRSLPELLILLERRMGTWDRSLTAWRKLAESVARTEGPGIKSLRTRVEEWDKAVKGELEHVTRSEMALLANAALAAPGPVLARSLRRHGLSLETPEGFEAALKASWEGMRSYLNNPWMHASLDGGDDYRGRIAEAILDGNLESVLDEHLWVSSVLRHLDPVSLGSQLTTALSLRTSDIALYGFEQGGSFRVRAHAALAFNQAVRRLRPDAKAEDEPADRTDDVRIAFNSPFWPYVLASTSVGQEGLDFHTWCSTVAHWDLPGDPVDLEQREGRVDRYAGLATRKALADKFAPGRKDAAAGTSPWSVIADRADRSHAKDPLGLKPWWVMEGARVRRLTFNVPLSEATERFEELRKQRLLYRLTLGQPDQADLVRALHDRVSLADAIAATIDLSPIRRK